MIDFGDLYRKYAGNVFRFALYLSGNRADAEDITSETFVRAFAAADRIETETVKGYLFAIARNLYRMGIRRVARRAVLSDQLHDPQPTPYERIEGKARLEATLAKLQELPELDRAAVLMRTLDELPYEEIGRALDISAISARVKVHRARTALMKTERKDD
jgi:RNA polymerase sigma-70 factor (ECF subfamily)